MTARTVVTGAATATTVLAATVALTVASLGAATAATAAPAPVAPKFLAAKELPKSLTPWVAEQVRPGAADDFCTGKALPKASSKHRVFRTELDTGAEQTITVAATEAKAKELVTKARAAVAGCLDRLQQQYPGVRGETRYHGKLKVEEGAHVYSIDTADPGVGSTEIALYSVGRDGRTVTVVGWSQLGDLSGAPLSGFKKTATTSVAKLY
ncbi:hypothetical protein [Streptomyces sp. NPDC020965]|uniref:hypothetical protein n=1 Tax=Streptomyces sp. NPDC020965 TaxID=3365105 RepID=UPI00379EDFB4